MKEEEKKVMKTLLNTYEMLMIINVHDDKVSVEHKFQNHIFGN